MPAAAAAPKAATAATGAKAPKAAKLKLVNGRLVSVHSKTGNPICSQAMSSWVKSRHGGPAVGGEVFKVLAKCRAMAKQNKQAANQQASGKLAEGRGTWQRSEAAAGLQAKRAASRPAPAAAAKSAPRVHQFSGTKAHGPKALPAKGTLAEIRAAAEAHYGKNHHKTVAANYGGKHQIEVFTKGGGVSRRIATYPTTDEPRGTPQRKAEAARIRSVLGGKEEGGLHTDRMMKSAERRAATPSGTAEKTVLGLIRPDGTFSRGGDVVNQHLAKVDAAGLKRLLEISRDPKGNNGRWLGSAVLGELRHRENTAAAKPVATPPAIVRPSLRDQAAAHRAGKGAETWRARELLARANKKYQTERGASKRALKAGDSAKAAPRIARAGVLAGRMEKLSQRAVAGQPASGKGAKGSFSNPLEAKTAASKPDLAEFARTVKAAAAHTPAGWLGDGKVFISHAHAATKHIHGLDLPAFKARLLEAHNAKHLELGRGDLFDAKDHGDRNASSTPHMGADYHYLRVDRANSKPSDHFGLTPQSAIGKKSTTFESSGGRTKTMLDMKAGDLPGQTSMFDRKPAPGGERADLRTRTTAEHERDNAALLASAESQIKAKRSKTAARLEAGRLAMRDPASHTDHAPGTVTNLNTNLIHFDPERFQYKLGAQGAHGVTDALKDATAYEPNFGGALSVWKDPGNGKTYVVNGHHRLDLANRLGAGKVGVRFIDARNAEAARAEGALTNIAEGRGTSLDAAKFFRDTGHSAEQLERRGVPIKEKTASEGLGIANLHRAAFDKVVSGELTHARGAAIGGLPQEHQADLMKLIEKGKHVTDSHVRNLVDSAKAATVVKTTTKSLFGDEHDDRSTLLHRAAAASHIQDRLGREKRVFGTVAKERNASELERGGNKIDTAESGKISSAAAQNLATFNLLKDRSGPVSHLLNEAAERVHKGEHPKKVHDEIYRRLPAAVQASYGS